MSDGLLEDIIQTEKHLQAEQAAEEQRVQVWRESELTRLEAELASARRAAEHGGQDVLEQAQAAAREESAALIRAAEGWCQRLQALEETRLREVLGRHLATILPEDADDHPYG